MANFTSDDAVSAGLVTELMTVVIQPTDPDEPPIIPTKFSGTYKLSRRLEGTKFVGYDFKVNQNYLSAESISGYFTNTEEIMKFGEEMKTAGVTISFVDDFSGGVPKYTADETIEKKLIDAVQDGLTSLEGSFEVSEGVATFKQKPFQIVNNLYGAFTTLDELAKMIEKFLWLDSLDLAELPENVRQDLNRNNLNYSQQFRDSLTPKASTNEKAVERNPNFWADSEKYLSEYADKMNRSKFSEQMQGIFGVQRFKSFQVPRLRHRW